MIPSLLFAFQAAAGLTLSAGIVTPQKPEGAVSGARTVHAVRASKPPVIDGRDDDAVWRMAERIVAFRVYDPGDNGDPPMNTEAKVAYDDKYIYVFVRAFDQHPDSIRSFLSRRDVSTVSDHVKILIDSYHDRRTGYEFEVNPAGVKHDWLLSADVTEDDSWDGVWDVATHIDDKGWTAEFRLPLSQMRYPKSESATFGLAIARDIARSNVHVSWPAYHRNINGIASQFGDLENLEGLGSPRRLELLPYVVAKDLGATRADGTIGRTRQATVGADLKFGLTSNLTVDATINPDFGQVEADPSVLNLTAFEQFFAEKRPFFLEGAGIFSDQLGCGDTGCNTVFYSRRIGRAPQLAYLYGDGSTKQSTNILAATKITGRLANGLSVGFLDAATERVSGPGGQTAEPQTNYFVGRLTQDLRGGKTVLGLMLTATNRQLDVWSRDSLRKNAFTAGLDGKHRFGGNHYEIDANLVGTAVSGSAASIASTQRDAVHYYQQPDAHFVFDSTRTSLRGYSAQLSIAKTGGVSRFSAGATQNSIGLELNDAGYLQRADQRNVYANVGAELQKPTRWFRSASLTASYSYSWNTEGLPLDAFLGGNADVQFLNQWWLHASLYDAHLGRTYDDRLSRGGPALPRPEAWILYGGIEAERRWRVQPTLNFTLRKKDVAGTWYYELDPTINMVLSSRFQASIAGAFYRLYRAEQWNGNFDTLGTRHYSFAALNQTITTMIARLNFTATPELTLQLYASPFITNGSYSNWREISNTPRASNNADRFQPFTLEGDPGGFNVQQFRSNTVIRWEFRPGSTLYLVWTQGRDQSGLNDGTFNIGKDGVNLFRIRPINGFLIKTSYWFNF